MTTPSLKQRLAGGQEVLGTWCLLPSPEVVSVVCAAGLDFVYLDLEHGAADFVTLQRMVVAAQAEGSHAIVRVAHNAPEDILKALDSGADGVLVPHVDSPEDTDRALSAMYFPPLGTRGYSPYTRAGGYAPRSGYTDEANARVLSGVLVEGATATRDITSIVDDPRLDFVYIGTYDISVHLGLAGKTQHPDVLEVVRRCAATARQHGKQVACLFHTPEDEAFFRGLGIQLLAYKVDSAVLFEGFARIAKARTLREGKG